MDKKRDGEVEGGGGGDGGMSVELLSSLQYYTIETNSLVCKNI